MGTPLRDGAADVGADALGRPVIAALTRADAAYGLGWAVAGHRRVQMDIMSRRSHGRLAAVAGPGAIDSDRRQRILGLAAVAQECLRLLPDDQRELLDAYAAGVNAHSGDPLPPWRPVDSIAVAQLMFQSLASDGNELRMVEVLRRTLPPKVVEFLLADADTFATSVDGEPLAAPPVRVPREQLAALLAEPAGDFGSRIVVTEGPPAGSNAWAVTDGRRAVLANDMHLELTHPSIWYAARVEVDGTTVAGVTMPGLPVLVAGANGAVAWGFTRMPGDTADLRELEPGATGDTYRTGDADRPYGHRREVIEVAGAPDVVVDVRHTVWGPVVGTLAGRDVALDSTLLDPAALDFGIARMYGARTVEEAVTVINEAGLPPVNAVVADRDGRIGWTVGGLHLARDTRGPRGFSAGERPRRIPPARLPRLLDPPSGRIVNCNNATPANAVGLAWNSFPGCRARRVAHVLAAAPAHDVGSSSRLQHDVDAGYYRFYRDLALRHLARRTGHRLVAGLYEELAAWKGTASTDEPGLALLVAFRDLVREALIGAATRPAQRYDDAFTFCYHGHEAAVRAWLSELDGLVPPPWRDATHFVVGQLLIAAGLLAEGAPAGRPPARWGAANRLTLVPVDGRQASPPPGDLELAGCAETVRVAQPDFGASMRLVVGPAHPEHGLLTVPGSPCAEPSANAAQLARWAAGQVQPLLPPAR